MVVRSIRKEKLKINMDNKTKKYYCTLLKDEDNKEYAEFLRKCPCTHYGHSLEIKELIVKHFHFQSLYLIAKEKEKDTNHWKIVGALPLFKAKSLIEGTRFVSIPFFPLGGIVAENEQVKKKLIEKAKELSKEGKFLQIRQKEDLPAEIKADFISQVLITDFILTFKPGIDETFRALDKRVRYDIKKAQKNNLTAKIGRTKKELDDFYQVYLQTRKKRGVPAWPYGLFKDALQKCNTAVALTYFNKKPIAAAFLFYDKDTVEYAFAGTNYKFSHLCPYYLLIWEIIKQSIEKGYKKLDFGGTTKEMNEGNLYSFKERWCDIKEPIYYHFYSSEEKNIPALRQSFQLYRLYGRVWRLLPKSIIKLISPPVIRQFI